jgi:hypothetical protein
MKPLAVVSLVALAGCSIGSDRPWMADPDLRSGAVDLAAFRDPGRPETPTNTPDVPSLVSIDRSNWAPQTMLSPMDGVSMIRTYAVNYMWTDSTARQRGQMPSPVSSLELMGDSQETQMWEAASSFPLAVLGAFMIIPRMITHSPAREVRYFPEQYWRAPAETARTIPGDPLTGAEEAKRAQAAKEAKEAKKAEEKAAKEAKKAEAKAKAEQAHKAPPQRPEQPAPAEPTPPPDAPPPQPEGAPK